MICSVCIFARYLVKSSSASVLEAPTVPEDHCFVLALYHCYPQSKVLKFYMSHKKTVILF